MSNIQKVIQILLFISGLILPNGDINWDCPCLGGMATGPCGTRFREAFSCFHYSKAEPKGSDCYDAFLTMQECMSGYPELYPPAKEQVGEALDQLEGADVEEKVEPLLAEVKEPLLAEVKS